MRAAVYHGPGDIRVETVPDPSAPEPGVVLIEVLRASICGTDSSEWAHGPLLARPPVVLGHEFVGRVAAVGEGVDDLSVGDRVVSGAGVSCGRCAWCREGRTNLCASYFTLGLHVDGGLSELVKSPAAICRRVPESVTDDAAAVAQPLAVALHAVRRSGVRRGDACAVIGVGGIGAFVVAGAAARGASPLIAIDVDEDRLETARRLGAHETIDGRERDIAEAILEATGGEGAHVVIEASGAPHAPAAALKAARRGGRVQLVGLQSAPRELDLLSFTVREVDVSTSLAHVCGVDLPEALELLASTDLARVVLDRVIPLDNLVEDGIRPLAERRARGKIVVDPTAR
ncbi:MAG: alcohol dehydrogenase catalytic domain-containing protein [Thermoleophilaceae bacterium]|nr:alcohol dehydrogenase catalytic domain-containing protein [Thermoleophilaceae bacterium]